MRIIIRRLITRLSAKSVLGLWLSLTIEKEKNEDPNEL